MRNDVIGRRVRSDHHENRPPNPVVLCGLDGSLPVIRDGAEKSLELSGARTRSKALRAVIRVALDRCDQGMAVSETLEPGARVFPHYFLPVVRAGEATGRLVEAFQLLGRHCRRILAQNGTFGDAFGKPVLLDDALKGMINTGSLSGQLDRSLTQIVEKATHQLETTLQMFNQFFQRLVAFSVAMSIVETVLICSL